MPLCVMSTFIKEQSIYISQEYFKVFNHLINWREALSGEGWGSIEYTVIILVSQKKIDRNDELKS